MKAGVHSSLLLDSTATLFFLLLFFLVRAACAKKRSFFSTSSTATRSSTSGDSRFCKFSAISISVTFYPDFQFIQWKWKKRKEDRCDTACGEKVVSKSCQSRRHQPDHCPLTGFLEGWCHLPFPSGNKMRMVGLTGGIASGKSTVSNLFKAKGIPIVDADLVARDVLKKGTGGWKRVVAAFGEDILQENGEVDRARLGQIVFSDPDKRQLLNRLLAPFISSGIFWEVFKLWIKGSEFIVLDIPLLFEAKMDRWSKPIIVVWVDPETQLQRLMARDGISEQQARNRINAQMSLDWKKTKADIVIDNSGSLEELKEQFSPVFAQVTGPLTWSEFGLSRRGALLTLVSVVVAVVSCRNLFNKDGTKP
ncbi:hypothetical protein NE237_031771 [Protea cynaroides]|uniref:Dephospho-CoA kinase n=1 Tax=Protea cynaroides TaxID=273540 RepID=A0A9Q0L2X9_9MAGN|nr:hypothetical protein NE237_031771 [Protea cynaroides]